MAAKSILMLISLTGTILLSAAPVTLVDFGDTPETTTFGLAGWSAPLLSDNQIYRSVAGNGVVTNAADPGEYSEFRGVSGTARRFTPGERIAVTWYNDSDETFRFTSRISFTDANAADTAPDGPWYTMRDFNDYRNAYVEIAPGTEAKTVFNITDHGVHQTDSLYSLVNIGLHIEWGSTTQKQVLVCDKIELLDDADLTAPSVSTGLTTESVSACKARLSWQPSTDNQGVVDYLITMNGEIEGYSRSTDYTAVFLQPGQIYSFSVTARDAVGNESAAGHPLRVVTSTLPPGDSLLDPNGFTYQGAFAVPPDFIWGGEALAFRTDHSGRTSDDDGFPGSLYITNLNQPEHGQVGEIDIPAPLIDSNPDNLKQATVLTVPVNIRPDNINNRDYVDIWRTGLHYENDTGVLYSAWSIHYTVGGGKHPSLSSCQGPSPPRTAAGIWAIQSRRRTTP
ncbi:MAG: fibronectin type III domain-containing protein [candidate division KSB1 bacterium]|nr:fibronectin type III domain-containing protein [candidate division KSB1 bacterium]